MHIKPLDFNRFFNILFPWIFMCFIGFFLAGCYFGLYLVYGDILQGEISKLLYIHVPMAWLSILCYVILALLSVFFLILKHPLLHIFSLIFAKLGIIYATITLFTGSLWGKEMWGAYWVWDARLTSVFLLFLLYLGYLLLNSSIIIPREGSQAVFSSLLAILGVINIPIIKYSVFWWNTLHQGPSITEFGSSIHISMLLPLFVIFLSILLFSGVIMLLLFKYDLLKRKLGHFFI